MSDILKKFRNLSPQQQQLLKRRLQDRRISVSLAQAPVAEKMPEDSPAEKATAGQDSALRKIDFSLFFFSADGTRGSDGKYRHLQEIARFGDRNGFSAVWTPERHFQTFGGLYPNPSVLSAALAMITERVQIRAGSLVLPLHSPVRVAEDWALIDNLSGGRAAISFATGWHVHDFVIAPANYSDRRERMFREIPVVQRLWRGEAVDLPGPDGQVTSVRTLPRPIQPELPFWVTASAPPTWARAGEIGANILCAMAGTLDDLAEHIRSYRKARASHGHDPRKGIVSLMLHTYLGKDLDEVRRKVRDPLRQYLRNYVRQFRPLLEKESPEGDFSDSEELLDFAFERYFNQSSLLGTPEKCFDMIESLRRIGVDDAACLMDFGLEFDDVIPSLHLLDELRQQFAKGRDRCVQA